MNHRIWSGWGARAARGAGFLLLVAAWALPVLAAEGEEHQDPWMDFLWKTVNFVILVGILTFLLRKPVAKALREAAQRARQMLGEARAGADLMDKRYQDQRRNMESLQSELERLRLEAHQDTAVETAQLKREAQAVAERLIAQIDQQVELARRHALHSIRQELAEEAVKLAEAMIRAKLDSQGQSKLLDERIGQQERVS